MAEELLVKCRKCGLVYDKLRNRGCPKCEPRVRPGSAPPADAGASPETRGGAASADTAAGGAATKVKLTLPRPAVPRTAVALVAGVGLGFGAARYLAARDARTPVLLPIPAAPAAGATPGAAPGAPRPADVPPGESAPSAAPGPVEPSVVAGAGGKAPTRPIELLDARRGAPRPDDTIEYTAVVVNRTANTVKEIRVRGVGEDKKGNRVVTEEVAVDPAMVGAGREATARIVVPDGTVLEEYSVTAWVQHGAMVRVESPAEEPAAENGEGSARRGGNLRKFPPSTVPEPGDVEPTPEPEATPGDEGAG